MSDHAKRYLALLERSYMIENEDKSSDQTGTRLGYLSAHIFDFTTYDSDVDALFVQWAIEVCRTISEGTTFALIKDAERYQWYLIMCNMPFFANRLEWGTSIRGAWWDAYNGVKFQSCGLWEGDTQLLETEFTEEQWRAFIEALIAFAEPEMTP